MIEIVVYSPQLKSPSFPAFIGKEHAVVCIVWKDETYNMFINKWTMDKLKYFLPVFSLLRSQQLQLSTSVVETSIDTFLKKLRNGETLDEIETLKIFNLLAYLSKFYPIFGVSFSMSKRDKTCLCSGCGLVADRKLQKCGGCKSKKVYYCSKKCQKEHWSFHKKDCC